MDLTYLIKHPETMNKETLYDLRTLIALYPYYQTARLLMLHNLYLLHDSSFDDELRRAAIYITDRKKLFDLVEAAHYQLKPEKEKTQAPSDSEKKADRTISLIDNFLNTIPNDDGQPSKRKPTPADATIDYVAYLMELDNEQQAETNTPPLKGHDLIDDFINDGGKIQLQEQPEYSPQINDETASHSEEGYFTATLARIYIKQGRYSKALEIIKRLNLNYPKKSIYFADQIRFLEKLIINNKKNN